MQGEWIEEDETYQGFRKVFKTWSQKGKLLLAFCMVSTVIKYKTLCHMQAMQRFCCEPHDMVICE